MISLTVFASVASEKIPVALQQEEKAKTLSTADAYALLAAAIGLVGSTFAAGIALRGVATAGFAAMVERPEVRTWLLIMGGLAEGIAVYGLLLAILILGKI
ncbi:MAG: hypothetical protein DRJ35_04695 [Thermoprotei archaeon]|nr:MAG: hypothetical protein DRJ35_04695 [Thermoprotei archaeon]